MVFLHEFPKTVGIAGRHAFHPLPVASAHREHLVLICPSGEIIPITPSHMRHVDSQDPKQPVALARGDLTQRAKESIHVFARFRLPAAIDALRVGTAEDR